MGKKLGLVRKKIYVKGRLPRVMVVRGKECPINLFHLPCGLWTAVGEYMGQVIEVTGPNQSSALSHWQRTATSQ